MVYRFSNIRTDLGFGTMPEESLEYSRKGGCFVSCCKGVCIAFLLVFCVTVLLAIVFFSTRNAYEQQAGVSLEEFVRKPSPFIDKTDADRLVKLFTPKSYRVVIHPYLDESDENHRQYSFEGVVWIVVVARRGNNRKIEINVKDLMINEEEVLVFKSFKIPNLRNVSASYLESINYHNISRARVKRQTDSDDGDEPEIPPPTTIGGDDDEITTTPSSLEDGGGVSSTDHNSSDENSAENDVTSTTVSPPASTTNELPCNSDDDDDYDEEADDLVLKKINRVDLDEDDEKLIISLDSEVRRNIFYTIKINFAGNMSNDEGLFYKIFDEQPESGSSIVAGTFTIADSASMIIPCFDDDDFQSTYEISIIRSPNMKTASNGKLNNTDIINENLVIDHYTPTPPMPSSEIGFVVTNITSFNLQINENLSLQLFTQEVNSEKVDNTMRAIQNVMNIIENYTRVPFNMNELSYVIMPHRQNYREIKRGIILTTEYFIPISTDHYLSKIEITNELAFQWFDGINQYELDEEIWLKKAIPMFLQEVALDVNDEADYYEAEYFDLKAEIMQEEMDYSNFKLTREHDEDRLDENIMNFMQKKGLCILKMFNNSLTTHVFREAIAEYFNKRTHNQTVEFYSTLQGAAVKANAIHNLNLLNVFDQWINMDQIPVINLHKIGNNFVIKQKILKFDDSRQPDTYRTIPIFYQTSNKTEKYIWMSKREQCLETAPNITYILLNHAGTGYYRVNYDPNMWNQIIADLESNHDDFSVITRAVLVDDAFNLARYGLLNYSTVFSVVSVLKNNEKSLLVWKVIFNNLHYLYRNMQSLPSFFYLLEYFKAIIDSVQVAVTQVVVEKNTEQNENEHLKTLIEQWSCKLGFSGCVDRMRAEYKTLMASDPLNVVTKTEDRLYTILCTTIKYGGWDEWTAVYEKLKVSDHYTSVAVRALGCTREPTLITKFINLLIDGDNKKNHLINKNRFKNEEAVFNVKHYYDDIVDAISDNQIMIKYAMEYFMENWVAIHEEYDMEELNMIFKRISTERDYKMLQSLFAKYTSTFVDHDKLIFKHILHTIQTTLKWKSRIASKITKDLFIISDVENV